jgi:hypothetical protein
MLRREAQGIAAFLMRNGRACRLRAYPPIFARRRSRLGKSRSSNLLLGVLARAEALFGNIGSQSGLSGR